GGASPWPGRRAALSRERGRAQPRHRRLNRRPARPRARRGARHYASRAMRLVFTENMHALELPRGHTFPIAKYDRIYRALARDYPRAMQLGGRASRDDVTLVHDAAYVRDVEEGALPESAVRRLGFPWSEALVLRALRSVGGTLSAL